MIDFLVSSLAGLICRRSGLGEEMWVVDSFLGGGFGGGPIKLSIPESPVMVLSLKLEGLQETVLSLEMVC